MRIGRLEMTGGFFLVLAWLNYLDRQFLLPMAAAACALHEGGHYLAIRLAGGRVRLIRLTAVGAEMAVSRPLGYCQEGLAALAGPAVNLLLAVVFSSWKWGAEFAGLNLLLALFNLAPVGRLDGGRALKCLLSLLAGPERAERAGACLDGLCGAFLLGAGAYAAGAWGNVTLLLTALWLTASLVKQNHGNRGKRTCQPVRKPVQ